MGIIKLYPTEPADKDKMLDSSVASCQSLVHVFLGLCTVIGRFPQASSKARTGAIVLEPNPGSKDLNEVLKRGSGGVSLFIFLQGSPMVNLLVSSIQTRSTESHIIFLDGSVGPTRRMTKLG